MKSIKLKCCLTATVALVLAAVIITDNTYNSPGNYPLIFDEVLHTPVSRLIPLGTTLEELQRGTENIVRGRILNDARIIWQFNYASRPTVPSMGHNFVSLEILEVFKGALKIGDVITIAEPYYVLDGVLITYGNYLPSIPYQEYFFFLSGQNTFPDPEEFVGIFWVSHSYRGRFHIPNRMADVLRLRHNEENLLLATSYISNLPLEQATRSISDIYMSLWQEVMEAYMDWTRPPVPSYMFRADNISSQEATPHDFGERAPVAS